MSKNIVTKTTTLPTF